MNPNARQPWLDGSITTLAVLALALSLCCFAFVHVDLPEIDPLASLSYAIVSFLGGAALLFLGGALWLYRWLRHRRVGEFTGAVLLLVTVLLAMCAWLSPMQL